MFPVTLSVALFYCSSGKVCFTLLWASRLRYRGYIEGHASVVLWTTIRSINWFSANNTSRYKVKLFAENNVSAILHPYISAAFSLNTSLYKGASQWYRLNSHYLSRFPFFLGLLFAGESDTYLSTYSFQRKETITTGQTLNFPPPWKLQETLGHKLPVQVFFI